MEINVPERIALMNVLPSQGNVTTLRIIQELKTELSFTEEDIEHFGIKNNVSKDGGVTISWKPELTHETKEIKIGNAAKGVIVAELKRLNAQGNLHISMLTLYEKFVESEPK